MLVFFVLHSATTTERSDSRRSSLSRRAGPVVIAADVFEVLSLGAYFFAVVVQAHEKSDRIGCGLVADDTRPAVEVRC